MQEKEFMNQRLNYLSQLNEFDARHYVALWAMELGWGGVSKVRKLTGRSMDTIRKGISEIKTKSNSDSRK